MQLTSERFSEIVQSLRSDVAADGSKEHRKAPRVGIRGRVAIIILSKAGKRSVTAMLRDLSANGIAVLLNEPLLRPGDEFLLILPAADAAASRKAVQYSVKRSQKLGENQYSVGGAFVREMKLDPAGTTVAKTAPVPMAPGSDAETVGELERRLKAAMLG